MEKTIILILLSFVGLFSCENTEVQTQAPTTDSLIGEWRYVRTKNTNDPNNCYENCPNFDFEKSKYILNFEKDGKLTGKINLLILDGKYVLKNEKQASTNSLNADFSAIQFNFLNKPPQTEEDTKIIQLLENSKSLLFVLNANTSIYNYLTLYPDGQNHLIFVKKK